MTETVVTTLTKQAEMNRWLNQRGRLAWSVKVHAGMALQQEVEVIALRPSPRSKLAYGVGVRVTAAYKVDLHGGNCFWKCIGWCEVRSAVTDTSLWQTCPRITRLDGWRGKPWRRALAVDQSLFKDSLTIVIKNVWKNVYIPNLPWYAPF